LVILDNEERLICLPFERGKRIVAYSCLTLLAFWQLLSVSRLSNQNIHRFRVFDLIGVAAYMALSQMRF